MSSGQSDNLGILARLPDVVLFPPNHLITEQAGFGR